MFQFLFVVTQIFDTQHIIPHVLVSFRCYALITAKIAIANTFQFLFVVTLLLLAVCHIISLFQFLFVVTAVVVVVTFTGWCFSFFSLLHIGTEKVLKEDKGFQFLFVVTQANPGSNGGNAFQFLFVVTDPRCPQNESQFPYL